MKTFHSLKRIPIGQHGPLNLLTHRVDKKDLENHGHVIGKSKSGKSRFLASLYINLIKAGYAVTLIDPAGDLAKLILRTLVAEGYFRQPDAKKKLLYYDVSQAERLGRYMPFNVLKIDNYRLKHPG